jgi:hypothetical protein
VTVPLIVNHNPHCQYKARGHTDAARRIADTVTMHWLAISWDCVRKWLMFRLADGTGGMDLFPTKGDAVRFASNPKHMLYVCLAPGGMSICEAEILLTTARKMADWGLEESERILIPRVAGEHRVTTSRLLRG